MLHNARKEKKAKKIGCLSYVDILQTVTPNGPTIKGGCVSQRSIRAGSRFFSQKFIPVQGGYGTCFCRPGANLFGGRTCRGTKLIVSSHLSRYCYFVNSSGAIAVQALRIYLGSRNISKNRDKQLTFIVRVRRSSLLIIQMDCLWLNK